MIIFDQVTKEFPNGTIALEKVSFHIKPEEFVFVIGRSGAGKTTLLRLLLREFLPSAGSILVNKKDISQLHPRDIPQLRQQIGAAFQDYKLLPDWTIAENISVGLDILGQSEPEKLDRVRHLLELIGLKSKSDLFPGQLSGGELQRVAIGRALASQPKVLFADEPTGNLDEKTAYEVLDLLTDINSLGTTVILATHNYQLLNKLKGRVIKLEKGKIIEPAKKKNKL